METLPIPALITTLVEIGRWPKNEQEANRQNLRPIVPLEKVHAIDPQAPRIFFLWPPFALVAERIAQNDWWKCSDAVIHEIDPELALDIGDFGHGSDSPILLDYRRNRVEPRVIYLKWDETPARENHWVTVAETFEEFAALIGLES